MDTTTTKRKKRLIIGIVAGAAALALAGAGTAYGINAANARAYDAAATQHAELLDSAALAEAQLPLAQHGFVTAWQLATAEKGSAASQVALVTAADDKIVDKDAKAGLVPLTDALKKIAADDAAAPTEDDLAASKAVQELLDAEDTDAASFAPTKPTGQFALSDEGADTGAEARAKVDAAVSAAQEELDSLTTQLEDIEARHDAVDAVLLSAALELRAAAESAVELAPAWKADRTKADAAAFDKALKRLQTAIKGETGTAADTDATADAEAPFETPHTVEPDAEALADAQELLAALSGYVAQANALQQAHADAVAAEEAAAAAAAAEAAATQQPTYDGGGWTSDSGWNGGGGGWSGGGGGNSGGGGGDGGFRDYGTGGGGGGGTTPPPGTCYRADTSGPEICY